MSTGIVGTKKPGGRKHASHRTKFTVAQVAKALRASLGVHSYAARRLCCSPSTIKSYVVGSKELQQVIDEVQEETLDLAEEKLHAKLKSGNMTAIIFYLKTKGKGRGYIERSEHSGAGGGPIPLSNFSLEDLEELRRGAKANG